MTEFFISIIFSLVVIGAIYAYSHRKFFFNHLVLMFSAFSMMNIVYLYLYYPVWYAVPNFVICFVIFIKYSLFYKPKRMDRKHVKKTQKADYENIADITPKISVDIISNNTDLADDVKNKRVLQRILEKIRSKIKVIRYSTSRSKVPKHLKNEHPKRSSFARPQPKVTMRPLQEKSYFPEKGVDKDLDVTMNKKPDNGYYEIKVGKSAADVAGSGAVTESKAPATQSKSKRDKILKTEAKVDRIFENAGTKSKKKPSKRKVPAKKSGRKSK